MKIRETKYRNIFSKILVVFFTTFLVGCTCLPFSSPSSKTPINGAISYTDILTYIGVNASGDPKWDGWVEIADQDQTLNYSISPSSPYVTINKDTGEISVLANALFSNNFTVTATGHGEFQDSVSTELSVRVRPPFLYNVENVHDNGNLELDHSLSVATILLGKTTYLFVTGDMDYGFSVFSVRDDGTLVNVTNVNDDEKLNLRNPISTATAVVGEAAYLFVSGFFDDGFSVFSMGDDGSLSNVTNVNDNDKMEIGGPKEVTTAMVGETNYLFVAGESDDGIGVFSVREDGSLINVDNVRDTKALHLEGIWSITTTEIEGTTYLFAAGRFDDGVSVFKVKEDGSLINVDNVGDNANLNLNGAWGVTTAVVRGATYLFVAGWADSGVSVFSVGDGGSLDNVYNVNDDDNMEISNAVSVTTAVVKGTPYLFVGGHEDDGVSVFSVGDDGSLKNVYNSSDDVGLNLDGIILLTTALVGETSYLFVAGHSDDGVSVFSINP